jgi:signal transduction histidine kinase
MAFLRSVKFCLHTYRSGILAIVLCFISWLNARAQEVQMTSLSPAQELDSILAIPYDMMVGDFSGSIKKFQRGRKIAADLGNVNKEAKCDELLGLVLYLEGSYDSSTVYNLQAMELYRQSGNQKGLGNVYCSHGYNMKRRNLNEAFRYMRMGLNTLKELNAEYELRGAYDNFGVLFEMRGDLDSAIIFYDRALDLKERSNDSIGIPFSLNNIGGAYLIKGDAKSALPYFDRAYGIRMRRNDIFGIIENMTLFGDYYYKTSDYNTSINWYEKSNVWCDSLKYPYQQQYNLQQLSRCYEKVGRINEALNAERRSALLGDSLLNEKNSRTIFELEKKYELSDKNLQIAELDKKAAQRAVYIIVAIAILLLSVLLFFLRTQVLKRKARAERDAALLAEREAGLKAVFDATEEERKRIAKDLHDGIGQQLSGLKLSWEALRSRIESNSPEEKEVLKKLSTVLDDSARDVRSISHQMMPRALQERGLLPAISDMLEKSLGLTSIRYTLEHYKVQDVRFDERVEVGVYRVCQELVSNIIKHSGASEVMVQLLMSKQYLILIVEDNGKGFSKDKTGSGIGLMNMTSRINTVNGDITMEPSPESGTVATIRIPVS